MKKRKNIFKEGDIILYRDKAYFFDRYIDTDRAILLLIDDDDVNLMENEGKLRSFEVYVNNIEKHPRWL